MFGKSLVAWGTHFLNLLSRLLFGTSVLYSSFFLVNAYLFEVEKLKNHFYGWAAQLEPKTIFSETGERFLATIVHFWAPYKIQNPKHDWIEKKKFLKQK